jgi:hypothetical protein
MQAIREAIGRGAPLFNAGDIATCCAIYRSLAESFVEERSLCALHVHLLSATLRSAPAEPRAAAWAFRNAYDHILLDGEFSPHLEAPLPSGFQPPGPVGVCVLKPFPPFRCARTSTGGFGQLFQHISSRGIAMTAPVLSSLAPFPSGGAVDMAFLYQTQGTGVLGAAGNGVQVEDVPAQDCLCLGVRGEMGEGMRSIARQVLEEHMGAQGLRAVGAFRQAGFNSPMVPASQRYWELQVPVEKA